MRPRVLLADPDRLFGSALALVLEHEGYEVVGHVGSAAEAALLLQQTVDVALVNVDTPGGIAGILRAATREPVRVIAMSEVSDHEELVTALHDGARGYVAKDASFEDVLAALRAVLRGQAVVPPAMLGGLLHELVQQRRPAAPSGLTPLSRREQEVLELLAQGHAQEGIAKALVISPQTARTHIQKVIGKLGAHSRAEAVAVALRHGLVAAS